VALPPLFSSSDPLHGSPASGHVGVETPLLIAEVAGLAASDVGAVVPAGRAPILTSARTPAQRSALTAQTATDPGWRSPPTTRHERTLATPTRAHVPHAELRTARTNQGGFDTGPARRQCCGDDSSAPTHVCAFGCRSQRPTTESSRCWTLASAPTVRFGGA
jgi:hypothetical protein